MNDIAEELGLSKSTVSRALSGSGRIAAETVQRVRECAEQQGFRPNLVAKALAGQKTLNIAAVMPLEATSSEMLFFHECLSGMVVRASRAGYSVLVCMSEGGGSASLEDVLHNRKADAVILTQLRHDDKNVALLEQEQFPFVVIGSGAGAGVAQVDSRMESCCAAFTAHCAQQVMDSAAGGKVLFVCGSLSVEANNKRLSGFLSGMEAVSAGEAQYSVCMDADDLDSESLRGWKLVLCSDDVVCIHVLELLKQNGVRIGEEVSVASFHDSILLESSNPPVSALTVDAFTLGEKAADVALKKLSGEDFEEMNFVDCSVNLRASTGN